MNIQAIGNAFSNNFNYRKQTSFGGFGEYRINPNTMAVDSAAFESKKKLTDFEQCIKLLKESKVNGRHRFNMFQQHRLGQELSRYNTKIPKAPILIEILNLRYNDGQPLKMEDIASFFSTVENSTVHQVKGTLDLLKHNIKKGYATNSIELDDVLFLPLENNPELLEKLGDVAYKYRNLSSADKGALLDYTMDVVEDSDFKFIGYTKDIADKIQNDITGGMVYKLLLYGAKRCDKKQFKDLLTSFSTEKMEEIRQDMNEFNSSTMEKYFIDNYVRNYIEY